MGNIDCCRGMIRAYRQEGPLKLSDHFSQPPDLSPPPSGHIAPRGFHSDLSGPIS